jgi:rod shape-determining protein MreC
MKMLNGKKRNVSSKYKILVIIGIIIAILIIFSITLKNNRTSNKFESLIKDSVVEIQKIVYWPFNYISNYIDSLKEFKNIKKENDLLKSSIDRVDSIEAENVELHRQLEAMQKELNITYSLTDYSYLNATVISRNTNYWYNTITIDKGTHSGVEPEMVVINASGLIGKVVNVTAFSADVRLITTSDTNNKISVSIINDEKKINGLINNYDYNKKVLEVEGISNTEEVMIDDIVYTSGLGGVFPSGILIGTVSSITTDSYDLAKIINVKSSVDFDDINYVTILKRKSDN